MKDAPEIKFSIRQARPKEYETIGQMTVDAYEQLPGMPSRADQPEYYAMLYDVAGRAARPTTEIWAAIGSNDEVLGCVTFIGDVKYYHAGGSVSENVGCSGIRLLAVKPEYRNIGIGKALTKACIDRAESVGTSQVILHTTKAMGTAWKMYEKLGFNRSPNLDFNQGELSVFGFRFIIAQ